MLFEKSWVLTVLERTMGRLETEMADKNKQKLFDCLKVYLTTDNLWPGWIVQVKKTA